jgi:putative hemolysin
LAQSGEFEVRLARAPEIPMALREIGRLRELAFRAAGEGSGQSYDLDRFDAWYDHLILWNGVREEIAGAYRLCGSDRGAELYTETLFRFSPHFFTRLGPALELGRSFIGSGYQRNYQSLLLLWRAIGEYVSLNPQYRHLFGPVSISAEYRRESRTMMAAYFEQHCYDSELARLAGARQPFRDSTTCVFPRPESIEDLDSLVRDIEPDGKGLPVLVRQYLKLSGRLCAFHVDRSFGHCLDGLIVVDLLRTARRQVERYLGLPGAERFYRFHKAGGARDGDTIRT